MFRLALASRSAKRGWSWYRSTPPTRTVSARLTETRRRASCTAGTARNSRRSSHGVGRSGLGPTQIGVRWNTSRWDTSSAISGMICTALAPVPIIATRLPRRSRSWSQEAVCMVVPVKRSIPGMSTGLGSTKAPMAEMT